MNCKQQPGKSAIKLKYDLHHKSRNYVLEQLIDWRGQQRAALTNSELDQSPGETGGTQGIRRMNKQQFAI